MFAYDDHRLVLDILKIGRKQSRAGVEQDRAAFAVLDYDLQQFLSRPGLGLYVVD